MLEQINEPIEVVTIFRQGKAVPFKFLWNSKEYLVKKVNLSYSSREGQGKIYYFAVSDSVNYFKLQFDTETLNWTLLESYIE
ncbi:MAG TPA: hypothetical protein VFX17_03625 [Patescibacteria group bacterium]|nr:hypothetical protein [Patescibacteria group bacterium]